jgi:hypothetical protein
MPRRMPGLAAEFASHVAEAVRLAEIGEVARAESAPKSRTRESLHYRRLELLYELAYLRIFVSWELFLEQAFFRYLCGYISLAGSGVLLPGRVFSSNLAAAELAILGANQYFLWHNPTRVVNRARQFFTQSPVQDVVASNQSRLEGLAHIRHRITHAQTDARNKFDIATMAIAGRRYPGSRPGAFLRDFDGSATTPTRWVQTLGKELQALAAQIA